MTKVMLINPPIKIYGKAQGFSTYFPLGLLSVGAMVQNICEVKIFDSLMLKDSIRKTKPFEEIEKEIRKFKPDIVGIATPFSAQSENSKRICEITKKINPKITVVFGGPDASVRFDQLLQTTSCDYCVVGEGEETFLEFIVKFNTKKSLKNIKGLAFKSGKKIHYKPRPFIKDLEKIPFPAYNLVDVEAYLNNQHLYKNRSEIHKNSISVITSRGCPFDCIFCSIKLHMGRAHRSNSPEYVLKHLKFLIKKFGIKNFHFEDDNFSLDKKRFEKILDGMIKEKLKIKWDVPNGIRADTLDYNLLKKIKKSGCNKLTIAIESGSQRVLNKVIRKNTSLRYMLKIARYCKKLKIRTSAFYVIGFPGETLDEMEKTANLAILNLRKYNMFPSFMIATPLYGTELNKICLEKGFISKDLTDKDYAGATQVYGNPLITTKEFSKENIKKIAENYIKKLKKEILIYSLKNPIFSSKKIITKIPRLNKFK